MPSPYWGVGCQEWLCLKDGRIAKRAVLNGAQLIVVDPRKHSLVDFAALHVPKRAGTGIAFVNSLMHVLIQGEENRPGSQGNGLDGLSLQGGLCQLAHESRF